MPAELRLRNVTLNKCSMAAFQSPRNCEWLVLTLTLNYSIDKLMPNLSISPRSICFLQLQAVSEPSHFPKDGLALHKGDGWLVDWSCWLDSPSFSCETGVPQTGLDLWHRPGRYQPPDPPASASQMPRLQTGAMAPRLKFVEMPITFLKEYFNYLLKPISSYSVKKRRKAGHDLLCIYPLNA